jgi:3-phenylpropionate/trans-cinnamate dioxygenase ferredoxin component
MSFTRVCALSELADESPLGTSIDGQPVCVVRSAGQVYALRDQCSHSEIMLSHGEVEDGLIECWLHGSQFLLETGEPTSLPANKPVPTYAVEVRDDAIFVDVASPRR